MKIAIFPVFWTIFFKTYCFLSCVSSNVTTTTTKITITSLTQSPLDTGLIFDPPFPILHSLDFTSIRLYNSKLP